jgi:hypothetical protein
MIMKKYIALYVIAAAALIAAPVSTQAQEAASTNAPVATPKKHGLPFHGKVTAVDTAAMTVTVASRTFNVTADTKITKDGKPATLSDITVGETIRGSYKKAGMGKLDAAVIRIGEKKKEAQ